MTSRAALVLLAAASLVASGCVLFPRSTAVPDDEEPMLLLATAAMPEPISRIARHGWFAGRARGSREWRRWECCPPHESSGGHPITGGMFDDDVRVHETWRGERAVELMECLTRETERYEHSDTYVAWPGPNSNTYLDAMLRRCWMHTDLPPTAIGRDYRGIVGLSGTAGGTGFQLETPLVGFRLGLTEGFEVHLFGLVFGIDWWPPAILVPWGAGRIGFDDL